MIFKDEMLNTYVNLPVATLDGHSSQQIKWILKIFIQLVMLFEFEDENFFVVRLPKLSVVDCGWYLDGRPFA